MSLYRAFVLEASRALLPSSPLLVCFLAKPQVCVESGYEHERDV